MKAKNKEENKLSKRKTSKNPFKTKCRKVRLLKLLDSSCALYTFVPTWQTSIIEGYFVCSLSTRGATTFTIMLF